MEKAARPSKYRVLAKRESMAANIDMIRPLANLPQIKSLSEVLKHDCIEIDMNQKMASNVPLKLLCIPICIMDI